MDVFKFFRRLDFTIGTENPDIKLCNIILSEDENLTYKLIAHIYCYDSPENINTSFYVIDIELNDEELYKLKRFIWNENKYDLYFIFGNPKTCNVTTLYYGKSDPKDKNTKIASFKGEDVEIDKINKWNFNSGTFWLNYTEFLAKINKKTRIDKKLIDQLKNLKSKLSIEIESIIENSDYIESTKDEIVQALIDRTLFIKFLEDKHIINSHFYNFHFSDYFTPENINSGYLKFLEEGKVEYINKLYTEINQLFNNVLFKEPDIKEEFLNNKILQLIYEAIKQYDWNTKQLSLFDFRFDVIPTEFISHIYEVFLESDQLNEGIYYTPPQLADLIIDDTITSSGSVLDPSCGSGMFLILAYRKLLEFEKLKFDEVEQKIFQRNYLIDMVVNDSKIDKSNFTYCIDLIKNRNKLINDNIYGIEKNPIARRLTILSLYLEIFDGIPADLIKEYIRYKLDNNDSESIFPDDFSDNIQPHNALEINDDLKPHKNKTFDFIVGNPPFLQIDANSEEIDFINRYETTIEGEKLKARDIVGHNQISQAFMLKIKDWAKPETRFGFVQNSSNFYNEFSNDFRNFFFKYYQIENFYELSNIKKILFRKSGESVVSIIFNNKPISDNYFKYYPVDLSFLTETFGILIIQEDKSIKISQKDILENEVILRDYLIGNEYDLKLNKYLNSNFDNFENLILDDEYFGFAVGMRVTGIDFLIKNKIIEQEYFDSLSKKDKRDLIKKYKDEYISTKNDNELSVPFIEYNDIQAFNAIKEKKLNFNDIINKHFRRNKSIEFFEKNKILIRRIPIIISNKYFFFAYLSKYREAFSDSIFSVRITDIRYEYLITSILNSDLISYFLNILHVKRLGNSFPKIDKSAIKQIPIPKNLDEDLVAQISDISKQLTDGELEYIGETKDRLNELIYDLYDLDYLERQRIKDFFVDNRNMEKKDLDNYKVAILDTIELYFENKPIIEYFNDNSFSHLIIVAIYFNNSQNSMPSTNKYVKYILNDISKKSIDNYMIYREKVYGENCIYIIKENKLKNWTETKAFEDGKEIFKRLSV